MPGLLPIDFTLSLSDGNFSNNNDPLYLLNKNSHTSLDTQGHLGCHHNMDAVSSSCYGCMIASRLIDPDSFLIGGRISMLLSVSY